MKKYVWNMTVIGKFLVPVSAALLMLTAASGQDLDDREKIAASRDGASPLLYTTAGQDIDDVVPGTFNDGRECTVRGGIPHFLARADAGEDVTVAFVGGSITQGNYCYRLQISRFMEKMWPEADFTWINAGVSGTGTDLGAFRIDEQVLSHDPDLVFLEFAVNGGYPDAMEGIVRKIIRHCPDTDICFLYTIKTGQTEYYRKGEMPERIAELEKLAGHYGIPSIHLGMEAASLEEEGKLLWKGRPEDAAGRILFSRDGVHPSREGGDVYAAAIARGLQKMKAADSVPEPHRLPSEPLYGTRWDEASMYVPEDIASYDGNWKTVSTSDRPELKKFSGWFDTVLTSGRKESWFCFAFEGDMFGFFDIGGPEAGQLEIIVDGELVKLKKCAAKGFAWYRANDSEGEYTLNRFNRWCNGRYRGQHDVIEVPYGLHQVTVRISSEDADKRAILGNTKDMDAHPDKYDRSVIWLGRILLRGRPAEIHRVKGVSKLNQKLKWDRKLARFKEQDASGSPADSVILFVGSSTIENWKTLQEDFPGKPVLNRGVSGTKTIDMVNMFEHLVTPYNPKQVFLYPGDNDIGYKWTPEEILEQVKRLYSLVREEKPDAGIVFISIKPSPRRVKDMDKIIKANDLIRAFAQSCPDTEYADVFSAMLSPDGGLVPEYYREDGLHLTAEGYKVWKKVISGYITPTYMNPEAPVEDRVEDLLGRMTLEEKIDYIGGYNGFYIRGIERLGLPEIKLTDGPVGTHKDGRSTAYPAGTLTAATWNRELIYRLGEQLGRDSKARGVHILLGPSMNIIRSPLCGRNFEYFTEDPYLNSQVAVQYVKGLQDQNVVATLKHYAANNQEWDRNNVSSDIDERTLHEVYLYGFRSAILEGGAGAVMDSYNPVNGVHATQNGYLNNTVLRDMWGFDGIVMSDWSATYDAVGAANGGLDLEMPRGKFMNRENLIPAIESGKVSVATIDEKVRRILRTIFRFGFFDNPQLDESIPMDNPQGAEVALDLAREGIVLLKNDGNTLPIDRGSIKSVAVIGPNAGSYIAGGGSSYTFPFHSVSVLEGIRNAAGDGIDIYFAPGVPTLEETVSGSVFYSGPGSEVRGLKAEYFDNIRLKGEPAFVKIDTTVCIPNGYHIAAENKGIPYDHCSMRWSGVVRPDKTAGYRFVVRGFDGFRLKVGDETVINEWRDQGITTREAVVRMEAGREYPVVLEYFANVHPVDIWFGWREDRLLFDEAADAARKADVAVVNIGFNESSERESNDKTFTLPQYQDSLVNTVAAANPNTVVILNSGAGADVSRWVDNVPALLDIFYAGQEGGTAVGEILFGDVCPSGKLPVTFDRRWEDNPAYPYYYDQDGDRRVSYGEGLYVGYRHYDAAGTKPRYAFGYGLSYTDFAYSGLKVSAEGDCRYRVSFKIRNTGSCGGAETAQLYIRPIEPEVERPCKELKGFEKVYIAEGETAEVEILLDSSAFSYFKTRTRDFGYDPGKYEILVGSSSDDIRLRKTITVE